MKNEGGLVTNCPKNRPPRYAPRNSPLCPAYRIMSIATVIARITTSFWLGSICTP